MLFYIGDMHINNLQGPVGIFTLLTQVKSILYVSLYHVFILSKTMYNKIVNSPQNVKSLSVLSPGSEIWN